MRKIVIDIYGADAGPIPVINGVAKALLEIDDFHALFVGDSDIITTTLAAYGIDSSRYSILHTDKSISATAAPTSVFGGNDDTSMVMAYEHLKENEDCIALLSPGNTGALLVGSICRLGLIKGLKFPALSSAIPSLNGRLVCLVDCGGNIDCQPKDLVNFARMGDIFMKCMCGIDSPRVGLLSVGREDHKGNALTKGAFELLKEQPLNFIGNIEGYDVVAGYADVIVSDGFTGNILLKCQEGVGKSAMGIVDSFKETNPESLELLSRISEQLFKLFDLNSQGGATFLGTKKTVVKMHGCANGETAYACIKQILKLENADFSKTLSDALI